MHRRTALALLAVCALWGLWTLSKPVTFYRGADVDYRLGTVEHIYFNCGSVVPIVIDGEFREDVPQYLEDTCARSARSHFAWVVILGGLTIGFGVAAVRGRSGPRYRPIDSVLQPLPSPDELDVWGDRPTAARR